MGKRFFAAASIDGADSDSIQKVHVDPPTTLVDGDVCLVGMASNFDTYVLDADSGAAVSSPDVLLPFGESGAKRWIRHTEPDVIDAVLKKHEHANKALLDTYNQTNANISDAVAKKHTQLCAAADFTKLDGIAAGAQVNTIDAGDGLAALDAAASTKLAGIEAEANKYVHPASHAISEVSGLQAELDGKSDDGHTHDSRYYTETEVNNALSGKSDTGHGHAISDVTNLQTSLDGKSATGHGHVIADTTGLQTALDGKSDEGHTHDGRYYTETETDQKIADLVSSAPETLDTLNELAAALGDDPNFATTVANQIGTKVDKVDGKGLSTNDYTTTEKNKLAGVEAGATADQTKADIDALGVNAAELDGYDSADFLRKTEDYVAGHHAESRLLISAALTNDFGNLRRRGGEFTFTNISPSDDAIDHMFDGLSTFYSLSPSSSYTYPVVIEFTLPRTLTYSAYVGIGFGNANWRAKSVKIEAFSEGSWVTVVDITNNASEDVLAQIPGNSSVGTTKVRYTLADPNTTQLRICHLWGYNYSSEMWSQLQMPRTGGTMYGSLDVEGDVTVSGTVDGRDVAADGTKLDGVEAGANDYTHPANHPPSIISQDASNRFVTDAEKSTWNAKSNLALGETSVTAYRGDRGKAAYDHSQTAHAPADANNYVHPSTHPASIIVQDASNRFMTDAERTKLAGIETGATADQTKADIDALNINADTLDGEHASAFADANHGHVITDTTGLQTALDGKSDTGHGHAIADTIGLQTALDGKSDDGHTHDSRYYTESEVDSALGDKASKTGATFTGDIKFNNLQPDSENRVYPSPKNGFVWDLTSDHAGMEVYERGSDMLDYLFKMSDNVASVYRYLWQETSWTGYYQDYSALIIYPGLIAENRQKFYQNGELRLLGPTLSSIDRPHRVDNSLAFQAVTIVRNNQNYCDPDIGASLLTMEVDCSGFTGTAMRGYIIKLTDAVSSPNKFAWGVNTSQGYDPATQPEKFSGLNVNVSTGWIDLNYGVKIRFNQTTGGVLNETFGFTVVPGSKLTLDSGIPASFGGDVDVSGALRKGGTAVSLDGHSHVIADTTGLQTALDGKSDDGHTHDSRYYTETEINSQMSGKSDTGHGHAISDVTNLQTTLDGKSATGHDHAIADTTGLQTALDGKSATGHGHVIADVTGLQTALDSKVDEIAGKGLSANDYTDAEKTKLAGIATGAEVNTIDAGDGLAALDSAASSKLAGIAENANNYSHPANHPGSIITQDSTHRFATDAEKSTWNAKSTLALGETSVTAYRGDRGKTAYDHSQVAHAPADANNYTHPANHSPSIITQDASNRFVTDAEKSTWNGKSTLALGETSGTAYRGDRGKTAYDHSQAAHAPADADVTSAELAGSGVNILPALYSTFNDPNGLPSLSESDNYAYQAATGGVISDRCFYMRGNDSAWFYIGLSPATVFNINLLPNKKWILSLWVKSNKAGTSSGISLRLDDYSTIGFYTFTCTDADTWYRVSYSVDLTIYSNIKAQLRLQNTTTDWYNYIYIDGIMLEEQIGDLETPSAYSIPAAAHIGEFGFTGDLDANKYVHPANHAISDVTSLQTALDALQPLLTYGNLKCQDVTGDWNTYTASGFYTGNGLTNSIPGMSSGWQYTLTFYYSDNYVLQIGKGFYTTDTLAYRVRHDGTWYDWVELSVDGHTHDDRYYTETEVDNLVAASALLTKLLTVDGTDSGLDADLLDGKHRSDFMAFTAYMEDGDDLNDYTAHGSYFNSSNARAAGGSNFPAEFAGVLTVWGFDSQIYQTYHTFGADNSYYTRTYGNSAWTSWKELEVVGNCMVIGGSTSADLNTLVTAGSYRIEGSNANTPTGCAYGQLIVAHGHGDTILQICADYQSTYLYWRSGNPTDVGGTGSWGAWVRLSDPSPTIDVSALSNGNWQGKMYKLPNTAGEALSKFDVVSITTAGTIWRADADVGDRYNVFLVVEAVSSGNTGTFLKKGVIRNDSWNWTPGKMLYASGTPGAIVQTLPTGSGQYVQVLGYAITADIIAFEPSLIRAVVA